MAKCPEQGVRWGQGEECGTCGLLHIATLKIGFISQIPCDVDPLDRFGLHSIHSLSLGSTQCRHGPGLFFGYPKWVPAPRGANTRIWPNIERTGWLYTCRHQQYTNNPCAFGMRGGVKVKGSSLAIAAARAEFFRLPAVHVRSLASWRVVSNLLIESAK